MKKIITFICIFMLFLILKYPNLSSLGIEAGLRICIFNIIPAFFPFLVTINIMFKYELFDYISFFAHPILNKIFGVSKNGSFVIIIGFTCGYPLGIKTAKDMYLSSKISQQEYLYLIKFCNNPGLAFVINYVAYTILKSKISLTLILIYVYMSSIATGVIIHLFERKNFSDKRPDKVITKGKKEFSVFNQVFSTLLNLCCFVIIFSMISVYTINFIPEKNIAGTFLIVLTEITTGFNYLAINYNPLQFLPLIIIALISGGLSISAQTFSNFNTKEEYVSYVSGKVLSIFISIILIFITY